MLVAFRAKRLCMQFFTFFHALIFWVTFLVSGLFVVMGIGSGLYSPYGALLTLAAVGFGVCAPRVGCALGLILLPLGGNRPGTSQAFISTLVGSALLFGIAARGVSSRRTSFARLTDEEVRNPIIFFALLYCIFSVASLSSIPFNHTLDNLRNVVGCESWQAMVLSFKKVAFTREHSFFYSFLSVYCTALAYLLGLVVYRLCRRGSAGAAALFIGSAFVGLLLSLIIGVLDYYAFIDLLPFRDLDPIVNRGGKQFRLQSTFGHSGWYAEYLTLAMPTCLIILALRAPFWLRVSAILASLALGEFVLILTYQRGGWLSYPLTLVAVWAAIYVVRLLERNETDIWLAFRRSLLKVLVSLPLTVAVSLLLVVAVQGRDSVEGAISPYVSRFKEIQRTGDRTDFLKAGMLIGSLHPILGAGADSFAWQFEREVESSTGAFAGRFNLPLHGSAHNVYAQTFSGKGICGLLALVAIPFAMLTAALVGLRTPERTVAEKLLLLTGACFGCAFLIYGNVQEVFYIQALQFLFFGMVGAIAAVSPQRPDRQSRRPLVSPLICVAAVLLHLVWEFLAPGRTSSFYREQREFGCFKLEAPAEGAAYRWCGPRAVLRRDLGPGAEVVDVTVEAGLVSALVTLQDEGGRPVSEWLQAGERRTVQVPVGADSKSRGFALVRVETSSSFVPKFVLPGNGDSRRLAVKLYS